MVEAHRGLVSDPARGPTFPRSFNRGLALAARGDAAGAEWRYADWLGRAAFPALFGRAPRGALGTIAAGPGNTDEHLREFHLAQKDGSAASWGGFRVARRGERRAGDPGRRDARALFTAVTRRVPAR